ncbi:ABC transporter ATP-binding protein [Fructilactobacillus frigidiflavus]|uniref:ABC transporter ATP-binding protein n=1 Tax=Fructilactobacillus frigidiflavus TaxID=3242688 RepID=UPI0037572101
MAYIDINKLSYSYKIFEKENGFFNNIKDFFNRKYKSKKILNDISFTVNQGEKIGILGPNGAGKSTLIKLMTGIINIQQGSIKIAGFKPDTDNNAFLQKIGVVMGQKSQLNWNLPASDTFQVIKAIYQISDRKFEERLNHYLAMFQLQKLINVPVRKLSLGERTKFEIIASLLHGPEILILDEPTLGMDIVSQRSLYEFINSINETEGVTVLLISHQMQDIREITDRILILLDGQIKFDGLLNELTKNASLTNPQIIIEGKKNNPIIEANDLTITNEDKNNFIIK